MHFIDEKREITEEKGQSSKKWRRLLRPKHNQQTKIT
jgi:hypothetical protein